MKRSVLIAFACALLFMGALGLCACSSVGRPSDNNMDDVSSDEPIEEEIAENQLVMKVPGAENLAVPLDEVSVTVYGASKDDEVVENAVKRLKMMGIKHIIRTETDMSSSMVVYRAAEYEPIARLIDEDLNVGNAMLIANDGSGGWSYGTDIAVIAV